MCSGLAMLGEESAHKTTRNVKTHYSWLFQLSYTIREETGGNPSDVDAQRRKQDNDSYMLCQRFLGVFLQPGAEAGFLGSQKKLRMSFIVYVVGRCRDRYAGNALRSFQSLSNTIF